MPAQVLLLTKTNFYYYFFLNITSEHVEKSPYTMIYQGKKLYKCMKINYIPHIHVHLKFICGLIFYFK